MLRMISKVFFMHEIMLALLGAGWLRTSTWDSTMVRLFPRTLRLRVSPPVSEVLRPQIDQQPLQIGSDANP